MKAATMNWLWPMCAIAIPERARRQRLSASPEPVQPNLMVIGRDGYRRPL